MLWMDHVTWTRLVVISILDGLNDTDYALNRLLSNQVAIGNIFKPFYGNVNGNNITALLREHIVIAGNILTGLKSNNQSLVNDGLTAWNNNAQEIANALSSLNPVYYNETVLIQVLHGHLNTTTEEALARHNKDYAADVMAYDHVVKHILVMSDALADGLVLQNSALFVNCTCEYQVFLDSQTIAS